jgi:hypothetical protein
VITRPGHNKTIVHNVLVGSIYYLGIGRISLPVISVQTTSLAAIVELSLKLAGKRDPEALFREGKGVLPPPLRGQIQRYPAHD